MKAPPVVQPVTERIAWHSFPLGDVFVHLNSKRDGLSSEEAKLRQKHFGPNVLSPPPAESTAKILLKRLAQPINLVFILAIGSAFFWGSHLESGVVLILVLFNWLIDFKQQQDAVKSLMDLKTSEHDSAFVLRNGSTKKILASDLVPGDVIVLPTGAKVPADARIIKNYGLKVNQTLLNAGAKEVVKTADTIPASAGLLERNNIVFSGTIITDGSAEAVVFGTGDNSAIGRVNKVLDDNFNPQYFFDKRISKLIRFVSVVILGLIFSLFFWGFLTSAYRGDLILIALALGATTIPGGLPALLYPALAASIKRSFKNKTLIRSFIAAQTLGSVSIILIPKSGIITQGQPQVIKVLTPERRNGIFQMNSTVEYASNHILALSYSMLVSDVIVENMDDEVSKWVIHASPLATAVFRAGLKAGLDWPQLNKKFRKIGALAFSQTRKYAVALRENPEGELWVIALGAPEVLLARVKKIQILNRFENALPSELAEIKESINVLARAGAKVVAVCSRKIENRRHFNLQSISDSVVSDLNLVGLIGLKDPVRPEAREFLSLARKAGLRTVMLTGDQALTARAVALEAGILPKNRSLSEVVESQEIENLEPQELSHRIRGVDIFSRIKPEHKLKITQAWQSQGEVVALVGDSVADAPALRQADVGIVWADASIKTTANSDLILLDSGLATLMRVITEGRVLTNNIKKVTAYFLSITLGEIILVGLAVLAGLPLPMLAPQILWLSFIYKLLPTMVLAVDPSEKNEMDFPPNLPTRPILDGSIRFLIAITSAVGVLAAFSIFYFFNKEFNDINYTRSVVWASWATLSLFFAFSIKNLKRSSWELSWSENKNLAWAGAAGLILIMLAIYLPPWQRLLQTQPLGAVEWLIFLASGVLSVIFIEAGQWLFVRHLRQGRNNIK